MARPARRTRSPHPGLVLIKPDGTHAAWRARYTDPDTGRRVKVGLPPHAGRSAETRRAWAIDRARALAKRRAELEGGAARATGSGLADAVERYYRAHDRLRPRTVEAYKLATGGLLAWARERGIRSVDELNRARLADLKEYLAAKPKRTAEPKGPRGKRRATAAPRSALAVNRDLRGVRTVLGYLLEIDLLPRCSDADLRRALRQLPVDHERPEFLTREEIAALLAACDRHDAARFAATRAELGGEQPPGSTVRYQPIRPFALGLLLSGMRLGEATSLTWAAVDLDASEIHLSAATKTHRARTVDLAVSPLLAASLAALRPERPDPSASVWGLSYGAAVAAQRRLRASYGAPARFSWQVLRSTCATYLTNAGGIFGGASAYRSARQLGHSTAVAERHYAGVVRVDLAARTLESAMGIAPLDAGDGATS